MLRPSWVIITAAAASSGCQGGPGDSAGNGDECIPDVPRDDGTVCNPPMPDAAPPASFCERRVFLTQEDFKYQEVDTSYKDGGLIWIENQVFPDAVSRVLATASFYACQDEAQPLPLFHDDPSAPLQCYWVGQDGGKRMWPFADASDEIGAAASFGVQDRKYRDIGDKLTLQADGFDAFDLVRYENHITPFAGGSFHVVTYNPAPSDDPTLAIPAERVGGIAEVSGGLELTVTLSGSDEVTTTEWTFEEVDGTRFSGVEIAPRPIVTEVNGTPARFAGGSTEQGNQAASLLLSRGQALDLRYDSAGEPREDMLGFVMVFQHEPTFEVTHVCVHQHPGQVILPVSLLDEVAPTGQIHIGNYFHHMRTLDGETRVDIIGASTTSASYSFTGTP